MTWAGVMKHGYDIVLPRLPLKHEPCPGPSSEPQALWAANVDPVPVEHNSSEVVHPSTTPSHPTMGWNGRTARAQVVKESALERYHYVTFCRFVTVYAKLYSSST
jgi:hypothetical protein